MSEVNRLDDGTMIRPTYTRDRYVATASPVIQHSAILSATADDAYEATEDIICDDDVSYRDIARMIVDCEGFKIYVVTVTYDDETGEPVSFDRDSLRVVVDVVYPLEFIRGACVADETWLTVLNRVTDHIVDFARAS